MTCREIGMTFILAYIMSETIIVCERGNEQSFNANFPKRHILALVNYYKYALRFNRSKHRAWVCILPLDCVLNK